MIKRSFTSVLDCDQSSFNFEYYLLIIGFCVYTPKGAPYKTLTHENKYNSTHFHQQYFSPASVTEFPRQKESLKVYVSVTKEYNG